MIQKRTVEIWAASHTHERHPSKKLVMLAAVACGLALFVWVRYENVVLIFDSGADGVLRVQSVREDIAVFERDLLCDDNRTYTMTLDTLGERLINIRACRTFNVGQEYPVIASLDRLKEYIPPAPTQPIVVEAHRHPAALGSRFFVIGNKSQSKWAVFAREIGGVTLALIAVLEALLISAIYRTCKRTT